MLHKAMRDKTVAHYKTPSVYSPERYQMFDIPHAQRPTATAKNPLQLYAAYSGITSFTVRAQQHCWPDCASS
jgi:hypothetical protein